MQPSHDSKHSGATRLTPGRDGGVLLLSMRHIADLVAYCAIYEFEDVITQVTGADRIDMGNVAALEFSRRAYKLIRMASSSRRLAQKLTPVAPIVRLTRDYDLFLPIFNHAHELYALATVPDWRTRCRAAACFISEIWLPLLPGYLLELLVQFDHIFVGMRHCVDEVARITGRPCSHLPLPADVLRFTPWPTPPARGIDICNIGRRSPVTHAALINLAQSRQIFYYYDTFAGGAGREHKQRTFRVGNHSEHRLLLASLLQHSRYFIANRARVNEPELTGDRQELSGRFYEGAAAGAVMLGEAPASDDFRRLFDWPDAVIHMPFDCPDVEAVLVQLDREPERLTRIRRQNAYGAALRHDWVHRFHQVLETLGIAPTGAVLAREQHLHGLAQQILQSPD